MGRGGIEPPTHEFSDNADRIVNHVDIRTCNSKENNFAITLAKNVEEFPEILSVIAAWPGLSSARRQRIFKTIFKPVRVRR
jgi:hypothetical protein